MALDVAGYSARTEADEAKTTTEVAALRKVIEAIAARHGGRVFNTAGDGFMLEFGSSLAAVEAAFELAETCEPKVRVGVHLGDVVVQPNGDLLGHGVNVAARLMARSDDLAHHRAAALEFGRRAVQIAPDDADVLSWVTGAYLPLEEDIDTSIALIDRSIALNPASCQAWMMSGWLRVAAGEGERAVEHFEMAMRLDPCSSDRGYHIGGIAFARFGQGRFDEAAKLIKEAIQLQPAVSMNLALLTACHGHLGQMDSARASIAKYRQLSSIDMRERLALFRNPAHRQLFHAGIDLAEGKSPAAM